MGNRKKIWGWFFYDWASQPFHTLLMTFVFGPYFAIVASQYYLGLGQDETLADANAQIVWSNCLAITGLIIGFGGPVLGAIADTTRLRKPWISTFSVIYLVTALALWFTLPDGSNMWLMLSVFGLRHIQLVRFQLKFPFFIYIIYQEKIKIIFTLYFLDLHQVLPRLISVLFPLLFGSSALVLLQFVVVQLHRL